MIHIEIERKWLIDKLPHGLSNPVVYKRYFIYLDNDKEIRVQQKGNKYEFERKEKVNELSSDKVKIAISKEEFEYFKTIAIKEIIRNSYEMMENNKKIGIKEYKGKYEGLIRAEIEFESEIEAREFLPLTWFGEEITG